MEDGREYVLVLREDAENLARFARNNAGHGNRSYLQWAADRVYIALGKPSLFVVGANANCGKSTFPINQTDEE